MAEFLTQRTRHESLTYSLFFESRETSGWGYGFDCDMLGTPIFDPKYEATQRDSYRIATTDPQFKHPVIQMHKNVWYDPATIRCQCGETVVLYDAMTNHCDHCGRFYNGSGQILSHPSQWGEETGERFDDSGVQVA